MSDRRYFTDWSDYEGMVRSWTDSAWDSEARAYRSIPIPDMAADEEILLATYGGGYEGDAYVLFQRDGRLYEVKGSHCSCYGLEGQWEPEETTWDALAMRKRPGEGVHYHYPFLDEHDTEAREAYWRLVDAHVPPETTP